MATKASKAKADYRRGNYLKRCEKCTMFQEPNGCSSVSGNISPQGLCDYYKAKDNG